jgi:mRNA interferase MazF
MAGFDAWDIVKVPFPYTNRPVLQHRPALVVGWHKAAGSPVLLWVLMITRADHRCAKIATVETSEAAVIGHLPPPDRPAVRDQVAASLSRLLGTPPA